MNQSLKEKSAARLAAAQILYQAEITGEALHADAMIAHYPTYADAQPGELPPNRSLLKKLLEGVCAHAERLEPWVDQCLTGEWKKERMSPLLLVVLRLAAFELADARQLAPAVIVNEYVGLTKRFFGDAEVGFIHAAIKKMAEGIRN